MSEWISVSKAWQHGLAYARANPASSPPKPEHAQVLKRVHGADGLWNGALLKKLNAMQVPLGEAFEYDPQRGCMKWDPMTCYTSPSFLSEIIDGIPSSESPLVVLEVRPFLGATSIALANALAYSGGKGREGFVLSVDTWRSSTGVVGLLQREEAYTPPSHDDDIEYYSYLRNVATAHPTGRTAVWMQRRGTYPENATSRVVPFPLLAPKAKAAAHWLGVNGYRPAVAYINAPIDVGSFQQELEHAWKVLGCGGTLAGDGYRMPEVGAAVRALAEKRKLTVDAAFWRAAGTQWQQKWAWQDTPEFQDKMSQAAKVNFTTWAIHNKPCRGTDDDELPQIQAGQAVPAEYTHDEI